MNKTDMKIVDRLIAAERMNLILEDKIRRISAVIWEAEREGYEYAARHPEFRLRDTIDTVVVKTSEIRKVAGIEPEKSTVDAFAELDKIVVDDEDE